MRNNSIYRISFYPPYIFVSGDLTITVYISDSQTNLKKFK